MDRALPHPARLLGPAGLLPFAGLALLCWLGPPAWRAAAPGALLAYGATILAFLGAVHWGLALRARPGEEGADWPRIGLGVVPALLGWVALLLPTGTGLVLLTLGILGVAAAETAGARAGLVPRGYLGLRWGLSAGAALCLLAGASSV